MLFGCSSPTSPTQNPDAIVGLDVSCPSPLLLGESAPCVAVAIRRSGQNQVVSRVAAWSSARPAVVSVDGIGVAVGRAGGEARLSASYEGREGAVAVVEQDAIKVQAVSENGTFTPVVRQSSRSAPPSLSNQHPTSQGGDACQFGDDRRRPHHH